MNLIFQYMPLKLFFLRIGVGRVSDFSVGVIGILFCGSTSAVGYLVLIFRWIPVVAFRLLGIGVWLSDFSAEAVGIVFFFC